MIHFSAVERHIAEREARAAATLCQDRVYPRDLQPELYGMGRSRRRTGDDRAGWRKARKAVAVLQEQSIRLVRGVDELRHATGGCTATVYEFADGSVAYFALEASDFAEAGELRGADLAAMRRIFDERGLPDGLAAQLKDAESTKTAAMAVGIPGSVAAS